MNPTPATPKLPVVLACSGCSRAGEIADRTARRLQELGVAKMACLASVSAGIKTTKDAIQAAPERMMLDACPLECGAKTLRLAGITEFQHFKLHELGVHKHHSEVSEETIQALAEAATIRLQPVQG